MARMGVAADGPVPGVLDGLDGSVPLRRNRDFQPGARGAGMAVTAVAATMLAQVRAAGRFLSRAGVGCAAVCRAEVGGERGQVEQVE